MIDTTLVKKKQNKKKQKQQMYLKYIYFIPNIQQIHYDIMLEAY